MAMQDQVVQAGICLYDYVLNSAMRAEFNRGAAGDRDLARAKRIGCRNTKSADRGKQRSLRHTIDRCGRYAGSVRSTVCPSPRDELVHSWQALQLDPTSAKNTENRRKQRNGRSSHHEHRHSRWKSRCTV
jgi:hypothetical protein